VKPKSPPRGFQGELRKYQTEGLGWLHFLREYQFGGCLADDMGLGKTIQVLSLLESRRTRRVAKTDSAPSGKRDSQNPAELTAKSAKKETDLLPAIVSATATLKRKPSIVIVPKSLIFNWIEEAAKFTPKLRILNYTGTARKANVEESEQSGGFDVLLTTYGTMRKDIADLSQVQFDYAILDESQAIKNSKAQCAKASRLLRADHRLAMTGTPIENHLGELWSLFDFLNPGMLGGSTNFARLTNQKKNNESEREETLGALSKAIAPFLLRRTKEQVLTDLPLKTEQTLYCDMLPAQKKVYNELKEYYRIKLAKKVETEGIGRSKIQVLEALLRLRQVACDPRLIDKKSKPGAKLELLQQQLGEVISEGHKVLVFSQFTSFLSLVKQQFDDEGINYEYLDGKSSNRAASVKRFQEDESVSAFLISIKAGGHGLNLTAADYVFLLDPWWNPAVEAQAIDRAHRMGQQNPVIAYRMICRDTVEEKIVSLQQSKRDLADKIVRSDESLIRSLTADDLQRLLE
jgi:SNF2 family DNA or RNA helicase